MGSETISPHEHPKGIVSIKKYFPDQLNNATLERLGLYDLVGAGHYFTSEEMIRDQTNKFFRDLSPEGKHAFIAESEGQAVGYIITKTLQPESVDPSTKAFFDWLNVLNSDLSDYITSNKFPVVSIIDVLTHPSWRRKGIQRQLWQQVITDLDPAIILGETKNPIEVLSRSKITERKGYKTYYGAFDVTEGSEDYGKRENSDMISDLVHIESVMQGGKSGVIYLPSLFISSDISDVSNFSPQLQSAFQKVITAQKATNRRGRDVAVLQPLISLKQEVFFAL